jgi:NADH:ubiquinone oxidoreductase subunit C
MGTKSFIGNLLLQVLPIKRFEARLGQLHFFIDCKDLPLVANFLKRHTFAQFTLVDLTALHLSNYFEVVYNLLSVQYNKRIFLRISVNEADTVPSLTSIFKSANWLEREV